MDTGKRESFHFRCLFIVASEYKIYIIALVPDGVNGLTPIISTGIPVRNKGFEMSGNNKKIKTWKITS
jgi:hypothetical protein